MEDNIHEIAQSEGERQEITDEILVRRIRDRDRQRRYRARKRLETDMQISYTKGQQMFWPTASALDGTTFSVKSNGSKSPLEEQASIMSSAAYGFRVYSGKKWKKEARPRVCSGKKWKKEARQVKFSTTVESPSCEQQPTQVEAVIKNTKNSGGRRNWKAEARKKSARKSCGRRNWKAEARNSCEKQQTQVETVIKNTINSGGRRNWKAEARNKSLREFRDMIRLHLAYMFDWPGT